MRTAFFATMLAAAVALKADPFGPGIYRTQITTGKTLGDNNTAWSYEVVAPEADITSPPIVFVTGGGGLLPAEGYMELAEMLANKGLTFIGVYRVDAPAPRKDGASLVPAIAYMKENVKLNQTTIDWDGIIMSGHSAGNHVWCEFLKDSCTPSIKGVVMVDPVDGFDPWGYVPDFCTSTTTKLPYAVPALLIATGLDPVPKNGSSTPCAPAELSNMRFYNAWSGPVWMVNATAYGHLDACDPEIELSGKAVCAADDAPKVPYKTELAGLMLAFSRVIQGNTAAASDLTDTGAMPVHTLSQYTLNGGQAPYTNGCQPANATKL